MINLEAIYTDVDDFCLLFIPQWENHLIQTGIKRRKRPSKLSPNEVITIVIAFHRSGYRNFKIFYINHVIKYCKNYFPTLVSYTRMLKLMQTVLVPLSSYFTHRRAQPTVIAFINSIKLIVCHNLRIPRHKVFDSIAERDCGSKSDR